MYDYPLSDVRDQMVCTKTTAYLHLSCSIQAQGIAKDSFMASQIDNMQRVGEDGKHGVTIKDIQGAAAMQYSAGAETVSTVH